MPFWLTESFLPKRGVDRVADQGDLLVPKSEPEHALQLRRGLSTRLAPGEAADAPACIDEWSEWRARVRIELVGVLLGVTTHLPRIGEVRLEQDEGALRSLRSWQSASCLWDTPTTLHPGTRGPPLDADALGIPAVPLPTHPPPPRTLALAASPRSQPPGLFRMYLPHRILPNRCRLAH